MATWDVFHSDRLEVERGLDTAGVHAALARGDLRDDDLIRPAGTSVPWARLADMPALAATEPVTLRPALEPEPEPATGPPDEDGPPQFPEEFEDEDEDQEDEPHAAAYDPDGRGTDRAHEPVPEADGGEGAESLELLVWDDDLDEEEGYDPQEEDEAAAEFTLSRGSAGKVEELDLAAMVDVAFQLVLFFLVTATTVLYKSLEVPKPNPENVPNAAAAQGRSKTLDDLKDDFIVVEIDPAGAVRIDREPVPAERPVLVERLRAARGQTGRKAMLLSADFSTPHRSAVLAYDVANEIGLGIAIARPSQGQATAPPPAPAKAAAPGVPPGSGG